MNMLYLAMSSAREPHSRLLLSYSEAQKLAGPDGSVYLVDTDELLLAAPPPDVRQPIDWIEHHERMSVYHAQAADRLRKGEPEFDGAALSRAEVLTAIRALLAFTSEDRTKGPDVAAARQLYTRLTQLQYD